ncbi:MAG: PTS glucose transporter subunit IIA [Selenomonadaceae bacterium]|nr:PTS glucose transporter subunit IIA [Selenomonadaceae bacterium]
MLENLFIDSPLNGTLIPLNKVDDKIFSGGAAGRGVAIKNPDGKIFAPFDGVIKFFASPGVIGLESFGGVELLIHVGLNTCKLIGESFQPQVTAGDTIRRGQILLTFNPQEMIRNGFETTTPIVVTNPENFGDIVFKLGEQKIFAQRVNQFTFKNFFRFNLCGGVDYGKFIAAT